MHAVVAVHAVVGMLKALCRWVLKVSDDMLRQHCDLDKPQKPPAAPIQSTISANVSASPDFVDPTQLAAPAFAA